MPFRLTNNMLSIVLLTLVLIATGCSGGGGSDDDADNGEPVSAATSTEISNTTGDVLGAVGNAMGAIQTANAPSDDATPRQAQATVDATFACEESGQVSLSASSNFDDTSGDIDYDATLAFDNCDGITGTLTFDGDGTITENEVSFQITLDGTVNTDTCTLTMDEFRQSMSFVNTNTTQELSISVGGSISGGCGEETFTCSFDDTEIDLESPDADTENFDENCRLT